MDDEAVGAFRFSSPIGELVGRVRGASLCALGFGGEAAGAESPGAAAVRRRLEAYLAGELDALDDIEVDPQGTSFQRRVWAALRRIPAGRTVSYSELARRVGSPSAVRAVGTANGANPVPIVIPCHRVVRSDGSLGGYGGGLDRKRWLLDHEQARLAGPQASSGQRPLFVR